MLPAFKEASHCHLALYMTGPPGSGWTLLAYFRRRASAERPGPYMNRNPNGHTDGQLLYDQMMLIKHCQGSKTFLHKLH